MRELILFSIDKNHFAIDLDKIKRIVPAEDTTHVAGNADIIEGVFRFEDDVINVLSYRKMIGIASYKDELIEMFPKLKKGHEDWVDALVDSVDNGVAFTKALSPFDCPLGQWLGYVKSYDEVAAQILSDLYIVHAEFHSQAKGILEESKHCQSCAHDMIAKDVVPRKEDVLAHLDALLEQVQVISNSMQKFLVLDGEKLFAVRIDDIDDIITVDEDSLQLSHERDEESYIDIEGIFEHDQKLVNLIGSINMPASLG